MLSEPETGVLYKDDVERNDQERLAREIEQATDERTTVENIVPAASQQPGNAQQEHPVTEQTSSHTSKKEQETAWEKLNDWYRGAVLGKSRTVPNSDKEGPLEKKIEMTGKKADTEADPKEENLD